MRYLSTFSGIGGLDRGLDLAGWQCAGQIEINDYCQRVLKRHWPSVPKWRDILKTGSRELFDKCGPIGAIVGGPPCQPASLAGRRNGATDDRWLWPAFLRLVRELQPMWVLAENPLGILSLEPVGIDWILSELENAGYECQAYCFAAGHTGAPHRRYRVFLVANAYSSRLIGRTEQANGKLQTQRSRILGGAENAGGIWMASDFDREGCGVGFDYVSEEESDERAAAEQATAIERNNWGLSMPPVLRGVHGIPCRVDRVRALGNSVVPQCAKAIAKAINAVAG